MCTMIEGIAVSADLLLSCEKISQLVLELKQTWDWEGRSISRIEFRCLAEKIQVSIYEQPSTRFFLNYNA